MRYKWLTIIRLVPQYWFSKEMWRIYLLHTISPNAWMSVLLRNKRFTLFSFYQTHQTSVNHSCILLRCIIYINFTSTIRINTAVLAHVSKKNMLIKKKKKISNATESIHHFTHEIDPINLEKISNKCSLIISVLNSEWIAQATNLHPTLWSFHIKVTCVSKNLCYFFKYMKIRQARDHFNFLKKQSKMFSDTHMDLKHLNIKLTTWPVKKNILFHGFRILLFIVLLLQVCQAYIQLFRNSKK